MHRSRAAGAGALLAVVAALLVAAPAPSPADFSCSLKQGYKWCGVHWLAEQLPVKVYLNVSALPPGISVDAAEDAVVGAITEWESLLPIPIRDVPGAACSEQLSKLLCYAGRTPSIGVANDGKTVIVFGTVSGTDLGVTRWCFSKPICTSTGQTLMDADIILRQSGVSWRQATGAEVLAGELGGPLGPYFCRQPVCTGWYDLQSVVTHELGHVIGLDEAEGLVSGCVGVGDGEWPSDLTDAVNFLQTMYPCQWKGLTNRRTLDAGDIAGLLAILLSSDG